MSHIYITLEQAIATHALTIEKSGGGAYGADDYYPTFDAKLTHLFHYSAPWACIDHICARKDSRWRAAPAIRWPDTAMPDKRLSDHFGVAEEFELRNQ